MKPTDIVATFDETRDRLTLSFNGMPAFTITPAQYCDQSLDAKSDTFTLRLTTMTRFEFEGWTRNAAIPSFAAVRSFAERCHQLVLGT